MTQYQMQEAGWASGPVGTCAENLVFTGVRSPDRLVRSDCAIPAHFDTNTLFKLIKCSLLLLGLAEMLSFLGNILVAWLQPATYLSPR